MERCSWCGSDPLYIDYHDREWGTPVHDDRTLFEFLVLEGAQAGLSWLTILRKRENYRQAFAGFDYEKVARFSERDMVELALNPGIVRNKKKIESVIKNAQAYCAIIDRYGSFDQFIWKYVNGKPQINSWSLARDVPVSTELAVKISRDMKQAGFTFFGPTICYSFMQAVGIVNDHVTTCFRYQDLSI